MTDLAQKIYAKRDELQALISEAIKAGMRVQMPYGALQALTVSATAKSIGAPAPAEAVSVLGTEKPEARSEEEAPSAGPFAKAKGLFRS